MTEEQKELTTQESQLPALPDPEALRDVFESNFKDSGMSPSFNLIKIPTGGGLAWTIPTDDEDGEVTKELVGVIIDRYACRAYWPGDYAGGNQPPDCTSLDAITGTKYGKCADCQFSQWGTGKEGKGQACKRMIRVYILLQGSQSMLPFLLTLPPTSAPIKGGYFGSLPTYATRLLEKMKQLHHVWTKIKLANDKSSDGKYTYSKAMFFEAGPLTENEKKTAEFLRTQLMGAMRNREFDVAEAETNGHGNTDKADEDRLSKPEFTQTSGGPQPWDREKK